MRIAFGLGLAMVDAVISGGVPSNVVTIGGAPVTINGGFVTIL